MLYTPNEQEFDTAFAWQPGTAHLAAARTFNLFRAEARFLRHRYPIPPAALTIQQIRKFSRAFSILTELAPKAKGRAKKGRPNDGDIEIVLQELRAVVAIHTTATAAVDALHHRLNSELYYDPSHIGNLAFYKPRAVACSKLVWLANPYIGIICDSIVLRCVGLQDDSTPTIARYNEYCSRIDALRIRPDTQTVLDEGMRLFRSLSNGFAFDVRIVSGRLYDQAIIIQDELADNPMMETMPH